jgi:hypothetical protein
MRNRFQVAIALLISAVAPGSGVHAPEAHTKQGIIANHYVISEVQAKLYYSNRGTFSQNILDNPNITLWNVIIGEGSAGGASENTLVQVVVAGQPGSFAKGLAVQLTAKTPTRTLLDRRSNVGVMNTNGWHYAGFWLYETGCEPVELTVKLIGEGGGQTVTKTIPFECGE